MEFLDGSSEPRCAPAEGDPSLRYFQLKASLESARKIRRAEKRCSSGCGERRSDRAGEPSRRNRRNRVTEPRPRALSGGRKPVAEANETRGHHERPEPRKRTCQ